MAEILEVCAAIVGSGHVISGAADKLAFEQDVWSRYKGRAAFAVRPDSTDQVAQIVRACAMQGVSIVPQGGNTGLVAGGIPDNTGRQVVLSLSRMKKIRQIEPRGVS